MDPSYVLVKVLHQGSHLQRTLDLIESNFRIHFFLVQTVSVFGVIPEYIHVSLHTDQVDHQVGAYCSSVAESN